MRQMEIALETYLAPLASARALRFSVLYLMGFFGVVALTLAFGSRESLARLHDLAIIPGIPLAAVLLSEMPLRDGIRQRTLLYPLLGPVSRRTLAVVRTLASVALLAVAGSGVVLVIRVLGGGSGSAARDVISVWLGAAVYTGLFGIVHVVTRRGLIASLALLGLIDYPLGQFPVGLRNLAPSFHLRVVADQELNFQLPVALTPPPSSFLLSIWVLVAVALVALALVAVLFSRKNLGELC